MPSEERNYYCICDDNCKFPTMTYEQIIEAIAEATGNVPEHVEDAFITKVKEYNKNATLTFWKGTQSEFNALGVTANAYKIGIDAANKIYFTPATADDLPTHAYRHGSDGDDPITPESIGAATTEDLENIDPDTIGALAKTGGTMSGNINMGAKKITNLATPTNNTDAATKAYVDETSNKSHGNGNFDSNTSYNLTGNFYYQVTGKIAVISVGYLEIQPNQELSSISLSGYINGGTFANVGQNYNYSNHNDIYLLPFSYGYTKRAYAKSRGIVNFSYFVIDIFIYCDNPETSHKFERGIKYHVNPFTIVIPLA